ncbi:MAG: hypothetical protein ABJA81_03235, partial [Nocardioidaceae bacterium]
MSTSTSRTLPDSLLSHPSVVRLIAQGQCDGGVSPNDIRGTFDEADVSAVHRKKLLAYLAREGVTVAVSADESTGRKKVSAASTKRTTLSSSAKKTAKKPSAKSAPAKTAQAKTAQAKTAQATKKGSAKKTSAKAETKATTSATAKATKATKSSSKSPTTGKSTTKTSSAKAAAKPAG